MSSTEKIDDARRVAARPVWLALEPKPVLAFMYSPEPGAEKGTAVLFCPPFGWEENCSYRGRRRWAHALAQAGYPVVTFALPGSGDSAGTPHDPAQLESWTRAVAGTAQWLADSTGAARITAIGIGLGGLLACRALAGGARIDDLILWAVPAQGRTLVRELTAYGQMIASRRPEDHRAEAVSDGDVESVGFLLSGETARDLEQLRLPELDLPRADDRRVLLLGRDGIAPDERLRDYFERAGATVTVERTGDYSTLMLAPQESRTPVQTIATTISWLSEWAPSRPADPTSAAAGSTIERPSVEFAWGGGAVRETPLRFDAPGGQLFGVLSESADLEPAPVCAVWLSGGALPHTGPNRAWVEIARRWATRGVPTVRLDHRGVGDSEGEDENVSDSSLYAPERIDQTMAVLDQLAERGLPNRFVLGGLCSGAHWSMHAALRDPRVVGVMAMNLFVFFWSDEIAAERATSGSLGALRGYGWRRLVHRDVTLRQIRGVVGSMRPGRLLTGAGHPAERAQSADIELALDRLRDQQTQALLLFSRGEPLYDQLLRQGVLDERQRWPNLTVERIPSTDHMARALWLQRHVHESLDRGLDRVLNRVLAAEDGAP